MKLWLRVPSVCQLRLVSVVCEKKNVSFALKTLSNPSAAVNWFFPVSFTPESSKERRPFTCFLLWMVSSKSESSGVPVGKIFMDTSRDGTRFMFSNPSSSIRTFKMSPSRIGNAFFHGSFLLPSAYTTRRSFPGTQ